jgi:hypothetical protein
MLSRNLVYFYNNWTIKAQAMETDSLSNIYDKYITLFIIYNNLYNAIPTELISQGIPVPSGLNDNKSATKLVADFLTPELILSNLSRNNNDTDITALIQLINDESFYIKLYYGQRQRNEDLKILANLRSDKPSSKAIAVLQVVYYIRCNIFHGHKDFLEYQRQLIQPLINILTTLNTQLFTALNRA